MAQDFFRIERGLELDSVQYLEGAGAPGAAGDSSLAPVGSLYLNNLTGDAYTKVTAGTGTDKWEVMATEAYVDAATGAVISWREPVEVRDNVSTVLPTGTATQPITVDGVSITDGESVLFSAISGGNGPNVYIYDQASGTFSEDANLETAGDTVYTVQGTDAGKRFTFNGTSWVQTDQSSVDELQNLRDFVGKTGSGAETPTYSSTNQVVQSSNLETAISALDASVGGDVTTNTIITNTNDANTNIQSIADYVEENNKEITAVTVTTITNIDTVTAELAKWVIRCEETATPANVYMAEVLATHDGVNVDNSKYGILKLGTNINGLSITVALSGGTDLQIQVTSTAAVNVKVQRVAAMA